jgi:PAS domain S-box-containing protein
MERTSLCVRTTHYARGTENLTSPLTKSVKSNAVEALSQDGNLLLQRRQVFTIDGTVNSQGSVLTASETLVPGGFSKLGREYELMEYLDPRWALQPLELLEEGDRVTAIFDDPGGNFVSELLGAPMEIERFLNLAINVTAAVGKMHERGLVHKDIKPAHILVDTRDEQIRLTGFGVASRVPRERQPPEPPKFIAGTPAYMAPEQTGRMNRSVDARSDLYALGVTFYQMVTGHLPFNATDALEWFHCHIAKQVASPTSLVESVPSTISAIIVKLLAKAAEDRYQTASGLEKDLQRCLDDWQKFSRIDPFLLGEHDVRGRAFIPEKLYGREPNIKQLTDAFHRVLADSKSELILVAGYSGIGKSAVVNELHKVVVPPRGLFASGKFDQYKRDIPYATLAQAFQGLVRQLLGQTEAEIGQWRDDLIRALGPNGSLITDLVPELKAVIGDQPTVPELPPQEARARFQLVLGRFINVFARPDRPLALFLDDLQWLDSATLDLIESLLTQSAPRHLLLIGAYRDNEVGPDHPLLGKLENVRHAGVTVTPVVLTPLTTEDLSQVVMDAFYCDADQAIPLARSISDKTAGNPFFAIQFLNALCDEALIEFDHAKRCWFWDLSRIAAKGYTDNVVDLMVGKLSRLPRKTQAMLEQLACLGHSAGIEFLSIVAEATEEGVHADLWEGRLAELIVYSERTYRFAHDRIQEAAYSLMPDDRRAAAHIRIGRLLLARIPREKREEAVFEIVSQFEQVDRLITSHPERQEIAELRMIAGKRAKASAAYASALRYFDGAAALANEDIWESARDFAFQLELLRAECEFLTGNLAVAEGRLAALSARAATIVEHSALECLRIDLFLALYPPGKAINFFLEYLKKQGVEWSLKPTMDEIRREYEEVRKRLGERSIEDLVELPLMNDAASLATLDVLTKAIAPALLADGNLLSLIVCRMANLSLEHGNSDGSCLAYVWYGMVARTLFGDHKDGVRFGRLGLELIEKKNLRRFQGRTDRVFAESISFWDEHLRNGCDLLRQAFDSSKKVGDVTYATYSTEALSRFLLASGQPLAEVQADTEAGLEFARTTRFEFVVDLMVPRLEYIRGLRGLTSKFGSLDSERFGESIFERHLANDQRKLVAECFYRIRQLQARFYAGDYSAALDAADKARRLLSMPVALQRLHESIDCVEVAEFHFYTALCHAAATDTADADGRREHAVALKSHYEKIRLWAVQCPENFENRAALVGAELARIEGREIEAEHLYEQAISSARANGFLSNEALSNELAARFHAARGFQTMARAYLREARFCYRRWGAEGKVRQLEAVHPHLLTSGSAGDGIATIATPLEHLDFATVVKVSQALSGETVLERLVDTLMRLAIEYAGAERGVLLLSRGDKLRHEAEAFISGQGIKVHRETAPKLALPSSIVQYVIQSREIVILDDISTHPAYCADAVVMEHKIKSVLCLPLANESDLTGVLYLENNLIAGAFTPDRAAVLKLLTLQAAISLENTRLYGDLARAEKALSASERDLRLIVDTIPAQAWSARADGSGEFFSQHYIDYVGRSLHELQQLSWKAIVHPDDFDRLWEAWQTTIASGKAGESEGRLRRADGEYRWFLFRWNPVHDHDGKIVKWYGINADIEDRKRAEIHLSGEKQILEMIAAGRPLREILDALCRFFEKSAPDCFCGIYPIDDDGRAFQYGVAPSLPASYTDSIEGMLVASDVSPRGQCIDEVASVVAEDIASDARWMSAPCRAHVLKHGLRAVWSTPICSRGGVVIGTVCIYQEKPGAPSPYHKELIAHVAHLASIAIERSQAVAALKRTETFLSEGQRLSLTGSFLWKVDTDERIFSEELHRIFEFEPEVAVTDERVAERIHPDDLLTLGEKVARVRSGQDNPEYEIRLRMPDGRIKYVRVIGRTVSHEDGRLECLGAVQDVTQRRLAEQARDKVRSELAHVSRVVSLGAVTASIAHEINQPLASIVTNAETGLRWMAQAEPNLVKARELMRRVVNDARRAAEIIDRVRSMASRGSTKHSDVALADVVTDSVAFLHQEFQGRGVSVSLDLAAKLPGVAGDRTQLQQVVVNLAINAAQALKSSEGAQKRITIRTEQVDAETVCCIVEDSGQGIDQEHLPHLFDNFFTTKETGMGLGLPIAQSIVEAHNGRIRADNESSLGGARFIVELPTCQPRSD